MKIFFQIYFMSVDDVVGFAIINDFEQLGMTLL
jgi:hypothetical protein